MDPRSALMKVVENGRAWVTLRNDFRKLEKSLPASPKDDDQKKIAAAGKKLVRAADDLELSFRELDKAMRALPKKPFPWRDFFGAVSRVAGALEGRLGEPPRPAPVPIKIIDVKPG